MAYITLIGGTGFLGREICKLLNATDYDILVTTRNVSMHREQFAGHRNVRLLQIPVYDALAMADICRQSETVVNLAHIHREQHRSRIDLPPARRGDFEEVFIELPRRLIHAAKHHPEMRILQVSCHGASPLSSSGQKRAQGLGEVLMVEASRNSQSQGHFTYLNGPKFTWGEGLHSTVLRLPPLNSTNLSRMAGVVVDQIRGETAHWGEILEVSTDGHYRVVYPKSQDTGQLTGTLATHA